MRRSTLFFVVTLLFFFEAFPAFGQNAGDEIMASFSKLDRVKSYRIRMSFTTGSQFAQQMEMAKQMGMDMATRPVVQEVVNPNLRKITMDVPLMSLSGMPSMEDMQESNKMPAMGAIPIKIFRLKMYGISDGSHLATYLDCPECEKAIDEAMRQQMRQFLKDLTMSLLRSIAGGPQAVIAPAVTSAMAFAAQETVGRAMIAAEKKGASLNQWTCRDGKQEKSAKASAGSLLHAEDAGTARVGGGEAHIYHFSVMDEESQKEVPMTLYVSASSGLPLKIEMNQPEGDVRVEYYDVDAPITIDVPQCMKK